MQPFDEKQTDFLARIAQSRSASVWIDVFKALVDFLNDSRTIPIVQNSQDIEKDLGKALLARRAAAGVIEKYLIDFLQQNSAKFGPKTTRNDYR